MVNPEENSHDFIDSLVGLSSFLEQREDLDTCLGDLAKTIAEILDTAHCSIMLMKEPQKGKERRLRVQAHFGVLPEEAYQEGAEAKQSIAGQVASSGKALLVTDIEQSDFARLASRSVRRRGGFISVPVLINDRVIGVINVNDPADGRSFAPRDLELARILGVFIGKSIQTLQLKNLLKSRFAAAALAKETRSDAPASGTFTQDPDKVAKLLAKSFFHEMKRAGMGPDHILQAATEIISQLSGTLEKHKRWARKFR